MSAHLLSAQVLVRRPVERLSCIQVVLVVEGVHMLLELEIHGAFLDSALVVLEQVLVLLELRLTVLLDMGWELGNYREGCVDSWQLIWIHILQKWTFLYSVDFRFTAILREHSVP